MSRKIKLEYNDRSIFARCDNCCTPDSHNRIPNMFLSAYTKTEWKRGVECPNCKGEMTKLYEVK